MKTLYQQSFDNILDTFSGADGGGRFVMFKSMLEALSNQADEGDKAAGQLMEIVVRFSRLIDISTDTRTYK